MTKMLRLLKETFASWNAHKGSTLGAALAYYTAFALAPLVILVVSVVSLLVERSSASKAFVAQISEFVGKDGGATVQSILDHSAQHSGGVLATVIGFIVLLVGASGLFTELQDSLNIIWEVPPQQHRWRALIRSRLLSFAMVFTLGFLVLVSLVASTIITALSDYMKSRAPGLDTVWEWSNSLVSFVVIALLFAVLFRALPDVKVEWRDVWIGAAMTAVLFTVGKYLLGLYIGHSAFASAYGAAGSLIVVLVWVFYSAQIFFFGAEFTRAFAQMHGSHRDAPPVLKTGEPVSEKADGP